LPLLSLLAPFLLLPIIARLGGVGGWAAIAIGQSVGAFAAIVVTYGWTLVGPAKVAGVDEAARRLFYGDSVVSRLLLLAIVGPLAAGCTFLLAPASHRLEAVAMTVALAIGSLSPAWYAVGVGLPGLIAKYEVVPRMVAVGLAAVLLLATGQIVLYPLCLIAATLVGTGFFSANVGHLQSRNGIDLRRVVGDMWLARSGAMTVVAAGAYSATPVAILSLVAPSSAVAIFASADKLYKVALYSVQSLGNAFQGWVAEDSPSGISRRMRASLMAHFSLGVVGFAGIAIAGVPVTRLLFGDAVAADELTSLFYGVAFLAVSVNTSTGRHILVPLGGTRIVLLSTLLGAVFGVIAMALFGGIFGGRGGAAGLALGELVVCLVQFIGIFVMRGSVREDNNFLSQEPSKSH
jgi:O-antigen/teichoic acid export membrane protein